MRSAAVVRRVSAVCVGRDWPLLESGKPDVDSAFPKPVSQGSLPGESCVLRI